MPSSAATIKDYLAALEPERRKAIQALRKVIKANLDPKFQETMQYGMIGYSVPHKHYPAGYHCDPKQPLPFASIASQKNHMAIYLFCIYIEPDGPEQFAKAWKATGKKLDMGKSCIRFKKLEDVPLEVVAETIQGISVDRFIESYEAARATPSRSAAKKKKATKKKQSAAQASKKPTKAAKTATSKNKPATKTAPARKKGATRRR